VQRSADPVADQIGADGVAALGHRMLGGGADRVDGVRLIVELMQFTPGNPYVSCGPERAPARRKTAPPIRSSSRVETPGRTARRIARRASATTRPGAEGLELFDGLDRHDRSPSRWPPVGAATIGRFVAARDARISLRGVSRSYPSKHGRVVALEGFDARIEAGETVAIVGPSGCGKTTVLELICGLQNPESGSVEGPPAALMPQRDALMPWASALDNAGLALRARGVDRAQARAQAAPWLERLGLVEFERARPAELSGGMRQRVSFVRTLLSGKPVLALDEPFAALDAITRAEAQTWLGAALADGVGAEAGARTVVLVTHDVEEAVLLADRVLVMSPRPGRVVAEIPVALPRPRVRTDAGVVELRARALAALAGDHA
jgi:NitT/TauT family transport system ATP-binding protein